MENGVFFSNNWGEYKNTKKSKPIIFVVNLKKGEYKIFLNFAEYSDVVFVTNIRDRSHIT
jgi:hypothetical protein